MRLYVVMYHDYEGAYVDGIYSTEQAARMRIESIINTALLKYSRTDFSIDVWDINSDAPYDSLDVR